MKNIFTFFLAIVILLLSGCNDSRPNKNNSNTEFSPVIKEETVEINIDNWQDYFEVVEVLNPKRNNFGDVIAIEPEYYFSYKSDESIDSAIIDVAINCSFKAYNWDFKVDLEKKTIVWENDTVVWEKKSEYQDIDYDKTPQVIEDKIDSWESRLLGPCPSYNIYGDYYTYAQRVTDFTVNRIQGTIQISKITNYKDSPEKKQENSNNENSDSNENIIEITSENWKDYFEFIEHINPKRNAFDEITDITTSYSLSLKSKYKGFSKDINVAFEFEYEQEYWDYEVNSTKDTTVWKNASNYDAPIIEFTDTKMVTVDSEDLYFCQFSNNHLPEELKDSKIAIRNHNFNVIRAKGNFVYK